MGKIFYLFFIAAQFLYSIQQLNTQVKMKLYIGLALAAVMANAGVINQAEKQVRENSGIKPANQAKLEKLAKKYLQKYGTMAQTEASKVGINFDFNQVGRSLQAKYGNQVVQYVENAAGNAQKTYKKTVNNPQFKQQQKKASKLNFNQAIDAIKAELNNQLQKVPNKEAKKNLVALLNNGAKQAKAQLRKQSLLQKNIQKTVNAAGKQQVGNAQKIANQAIETPQFQ